MERAGAAAAELAATLAGDKGKDILVLAGPGNNGGDARVVAARLRERFFRVDVVSEMAQMPQKPWALVVDGLFGIGLARDITGEHAALVEYANRQRCPVLALDIPSGLHADTGRVLGLRGARDAYGDVHRAQARACSRSTDRTIAARSWSPTWTSRSQSCGAARLDRAAGAVPQPAQAAAAQLPQGHGRLAGDPGRRRRHDRRRAARRPRRAEAGRRPGLCRPARRRVVARSRTARS